MTLDDLDEQEANLFAMELLVPTQFLLKDLAGDFSIDPTGDQRLKTLAKRYGVDETLMLLRIQDVANSHTRKGKTPA